MIKGLLQQNQLFKDIGEDKINEAMEQLLKQKQKRTGQANLPHVIKAKNDQKLQPNNTVKNHIRTQKTRDHS